VQRFSPSANMIRNAKPDPFCIVASGICGMVLNLQLRFWGRVLAVQEPGRLPQVGVVLCPILRTGTSELL
jgi:hypothetical protein